METLSWFCRFCTDSFLKKKCLRAAAAVATLLLFGHIYYLQTGDFRLDYLLVARSSQSETGLSGGDVGKILRKNYYYLDHGNQTFAFLSEDRLHVLKLFKKEYLCRGKWSSILPPISFFRCFFLHRGKSKEKRRKKLLDGYKTGYLHDKKNSGLIYYHPVKEDIAELRTTLVTALGNKISIDLNGFVFAIQVKVTTTKEELFRLFSKKDITTVKQRFQQLLDLYFDEYRKGIIDNDHNFLANTGFCGEQAIRQDVGKVVKIEHLSQEFVESDLRKLRDERIFPWLKKYFPEYLETLVKVIDERIREKKAQMFSLTKQKN